AADRIVRDGSPYESHSDGFGLRKNFFDAVSGWRQAGHPMRELDNSQPHFFLPSLPPLRVSRPGHLSSSFRANRASGRNGGQRPPRYMQSPPCWHGKPRGYLPVPPPRREAPCRSNHSICSASSSQPRATSSNALFMDGLFVSAARFLASAALCRYSSDRDDM